MRTETNGNGGDKSNETDIGIVLLQHIESQIGRADIKTQITLAIDTILIASLGRGAISALFGNAFWDTNKTEAVFSALMFLFLIMSTFVTLFAVMPKLKLPKQMPQNLFYFASISETSESKFIEGFVAKQGDFKSMILSEVYSLAKIAKSKYKRIQLSYWFLFIALLCWTLTQLLRAVSK